MTLFDRIRQSLATGTPARTSRSAKPTAPSRTPEPHPGDMFPDPDFAQPMTPELEARVREILRRTR